MLRRVAVAPPQDRPALHLVQTTPHAVGVTGPERELEAGLADRAPDAQGLRDGLAGDLLRALLEVGRGEEEGRILPSADRSLPPGPCDRIHLPGHSGTAPAGIPRTALSRELHGSPAQVVPTSFVG